MLGAFDNNWVDLVDWLIDYCLTSIEQYFSYIQNKFSNIGKLMKWKKFGRDEKFSLCSSYNAPALFRNLHNRSLECRECGPLQTRYLLSSTVGLSVLYPDNPPNWEGFPLFTTWGCSEQLCVFEPWKSSPVPRLDFVTCIKVQKELWRLISKCYL